MAISSLPTAIICGLQPPLLNDLKSIVAPTPIVQNDERRDHRVLWVNVQKWLSEIGVENTPF
jgi:hypothetical protein